MMNHQGPPKEESFPGAPKTQDSTQRTPETPGLCQRWVQVGGRSEGMERVPLEAFLAEIAEEARSYRKNDGSPAKRKEEGHSRQEEQDM